MAQKTQVSALRAAPNLEATALNAAQVKIASLEAALQAQGAELASMKQAQKQQVKVLAKLTAFVQAAQTKEAHQAVIVARH